MDITLFRAITLDLQHHSFPDVIGVEHDSLRGWLVTPLNNGELFNPAGYTAHLWSIGVSQDTPQVSVCEVQPDGKIACPITPAQLVEGLQTAHQLVLSLGTEYIRFPAFRVLVGEAIDNTNPGNSGGGGGVWSDMLATMQAAVDRAEAMRNQAEISAGQANADKVAAEAANAAAQSAKMQADTCKIQACQCAADALASKTAAAASASQASGSATAAAGNASTASTKASQAASSATAAGNAKTTVEQIRDSLQATVTAAENATQAANDAVSGVQDVLNGALATQSTKGLMSPEDKTKLDGVAPNANNYVHPASHALSEVSGLQTALGAKVAKADIVDALTSTDPTKVLSAAQGKNLKTQIDGIATNMQTTPNGKYYVQTFPNGTKRVMGYVDITVAVQNPWGNTGLCFITVPITIPAISSIQTVNVFCTQDDQYGTIVAGSNINGNKVYCMMIRKEDTSRLRRLHFSVIGT